MKDYTPFKENGKVEAAAPEPYPPLEVEGPNPQYARLLGIDMAGGRGEMTSITQYLYHSWTLPDFDNAAPTLRQIAQVEMHHLDMLGQLIVLLGADPRFSCDQRGSCAWWSGSMVCYSHDVRQILLNNITDEKKAAEFYRTAACDIPDPCVAAVLNRIARDEVLHAEIFTRFLKDCQ